MHLLFLQLLMPCLLLPLGKAGRCVDGCQRQSSFSFVLLERGRRDLHMANHEDTEAKPDLFVAVPHLIDTSLAGEGQRQREKMLSRLGRLWKKPETELHPTREVKGSPSGIQTLPQPADVRKVESSPLQEEAKKFWHRFMFRKGPSSQGVILPIKSHEVHRETCRTVPFNQTIAHEDCEKVVVQNNLCFGKCGSIHFPGEGAHPHNLCSHCSPTKFTTVRLRLNCPSPTPVVKVVMHVQECQCMVKTEHGEGHLLSAAFQDPFVPGFPASKAIP